MKWLLWLYTAIKMTTFQSKWESIVSYTDYGHKMSRFHILSDKLMTHYWDVSSVPIEPAVILRYHEKRGKVPRIRIISFRKTSLSILKTHLTWRLRSCISTFKIVPINSYKNDYYWNIFSQKKYLQILSDENWLQNFNLSHFWHTEIICNYCAFKKLVKIGYFLNS